MGQPAGDRLATGHRHRHLGIAGSHRYQGQETPRPGGQTPAPFLGASVPLAKWGLGVLCLPSYPLPWLTWVALEKC